MLTSTVLGTSEPCVVFPAFVSETELILSRWAYKFQAAGREIYLNPLPKYVSKTGPHNLIVEFVFRQQNMGGPMSHRPDGAHKRAGGGPFRDAKRHLCVGVIDLLVGAKRGDRGQFPGR